jgi:hypothetical protein
MLGRYGGRPDESAANGAAYSAEDLAALAAFNQEPREGGRGPMRSDGLLQVPGYPQGGAPRRHRRL